MWFKRCIPFKSEKISHKRKYIKEIMEIMNPPILNLALISFLHPISSKKSGTLPTRKSILPSVKEEWGSHYGQDHVLVFPTWILYEKWKILFSWYYIRVSCSKLRSSFRSISYWLTLFCLKVFFDLRSFDLKKESSFIISGFLWYFFAHCCCKFLWWIVTDFSILWSVEKDLLNFQG